MAGHLTTISQRKSSKHAAVARAGASVTMSEWTPPTRIRSKMLKGGRLAGAGSGVLRAVMHLKLRVENSPPGAGAA